MPGEKLTKDSPFPRDKISSSRTKLQYVEKLSTHLKNQGVNDCVLETVVDENATPNVITMTYDEANDKATFFYSSKTQQRLTKLVTCPPICIPSITRNIPKKERGDFVPPIASTDSPLKLQEYVGAVFFCVMGSESNHYAVKVLSKEKRKEKQWFILVRPQQWDNRGVRFAREALLMAASHMMPNQPTFHVDDDRYYFDQYPEGKKSNESLSMKAGVDLCLAHLTNTELDLKNVGLGNVSRLGCVYEGCELQVGARVNQAFLLASRSTTPQMTFIVPMMRFLDAEGYLFIKRLAEQGGFLASLVGVEDYELCYRLAAQHPKLHSTSARFMRYISTEKDEKKEEKLPTTIEEHTDTGHVDKLRQLYELLDRFTVQTSGKTVGWKSQCSWLVPAHSEREVQNGWHMPTCLVLGKVNAVPHESAQLPNSSLELDCVLHCLPNGTHKIQLRVKTRHMVNDVSCTLRIENASAQETVANICFKMIEKEASFEVSCSPPPLDGQCISLKSELSMNNTLLQFKHHVSFIDFLLPAVNFDTDPSSEYWGGTNINRQEVEVDKNTFESKGSLVKHFTKVLTPEENKFVSSLAARYHCISDPVLLTSHLLDNNNILVEVRSLNDTLCNAVFGAFT